MIRWDDPAATVSWLFLIIVVESFAALFVSLYKKDRDKRKLMFAIAFAFSGPSYFQYMMELPESFNFSQMDIHSCSLRSVSINCYSPI
jgi:hypothetical protein